MDARGNSRFRRTTGRRTAAVLALGAACWTAIFAVTVALKDFPRGLLALLCGALVAAGAWEGVLRRGWGRVAGLAVAAVALLAFGLLLVDDGFLRSVLLLGIGVLIWHTGARLAFRPQVDLPAADPPERPVLFINPRSGDGKAARFSLASEARDRGIEPIELRPGDDLADLVRTAVEGGADAVAVAGGDGSQAVAAAVAAWCDVPYACIPSGTRNHFALDLGVDRDDVVGALDALVDGGERVVDLGEVNGRVFVNNVSLGVYAEAVQRTGYRQAKVRTLLETVPDTLGARGIAGPHLDHAGRAATARRGGHPRRQQPVPPGWRGGRRDPPGRGPGRPGHHRRGPAEHPGQPAAPRRGGSGPHRSSASTRRSRSRWGSTARPSS